MLIDIIPISPDIKFDLIEKEIKKLFFDFFQDDEFFKKLSLCYQYNDVKNFIYYNPESNYTFVINSDVKKCFLFLIINLIKKREIDILFSYNVLLIAQKLSFNEIEYFEIFKFINWQTSKKGLKYFLTISDFSEILKKKIFSKKISINEAYLFHNHFKNDYDIFLNKLSLSLSFSILNKVLRYAVEYSKKENKPINEIINIVDFDEKKIIDSLFKLKFPIYSKINKIYLSFIDSLKLPKNVNILYDESFEKEEYKLEIKFKDFKSLHEKIYVVTQNMEKVKSKDDFKDLFIHNNLFDEKKYDE